MMKNKMYQIFIVLLLLITLGSCSNDSPIDNDKGDATNKITNEITNKVVEYENIKVEDLQSAVVEAVKKVENAVIGVTCKGMISPGMGRPEVETTLSTGSGVIYKREEIKENNQLISYRYYVLTNRHVITDEDIADNKCNIYAYLEQEDQEFKANVVGYDTKVDIAVITFEHTRLIQPVVIAESASLEKGAFVIAIGNPYGYDYYGSATFGVVSGPNRYVSTDTDDDGIDDFYATYIQHDVAINSGNSGGGLFNIKGELVGINTLKLVVDNVENMGFAIPSDTINLLVEEYIEPGKEIIRARLGVLGMEVRSLTDYAIEENDLLPLPDIYNGETPYGVYVSQTYEDTTIASTPITEHDIILKVGGVKITRQYIINALLNSLVNFQVGDTVEIEYYSRVDGIVKTIDVVLKK